MEKVNLRKIRDLRGHKSAVYTLAPSNRKGAFLSGGSEGVVAEWEWGKEDARAIAHTNAPIFSMQTIPSHDLLLLGLNDGLLVFADLKTRKIIKSVQAHKKAIFDIQPFPALKHFLVSSQEGAVSLWSLETMQPIHYQAISPKSVRCIVFSPDHKSVLIGSSDNKIRVFDLGLNIEREWLAHKLSIFRLAFSPDGKWLHSIGRDAHINTWDVGSGYSLNNTVPAHLFAINDLVFHPWENYFFTGSMDKTIKIWKEGGSPELLKVVDFERNACHRNGVNRLLWVEDRLISCGDDRLVMEWAL